MPTPQTREALLAAFDDARRAHLAFLATIPRERMMEPGAAGPWTFKDVVAHLTAWRAYTIARLEALAAGAPEPARPWPAELSDAGDDAINAWFYERDRDLPLDTVLANWESSFDQLAAVGATLPDAALFDPSFVPWMEGTALAAPIATGVLGHWREEHEPAVRSWLAAGS